jgi:hypothetical protein
VPEVLGARSSLILALALSSCTRAPVGEELYGDAGRRARVFEPNRKPGYLKDVSVPPPLGGSDLDAGGGGDDEDGDADYESDGGDPDVRAMPADAASRVDGVAPDAPSCGDGKKLCSTYCVDVADPRFGCAAASCDPCTLPSANMDITCSSSGSCLPECTAGFLDCDGNPENGCEVDGRSNREHCGACGRPCGEHQSCSAGSCG